MTDHKVFGIGFQKTGSSSLGRIFDKLGYQTVGYNEFRHLAKRDQVTWDEVAPLALEIAARCDAAKDTPWPLLYKELDAAFPDARFIHVIRDSEAWLNSALNDFQSHPNAIHRLIYGSDGPVGYETDWLSRYERHNTEVAAYFADRPDDYLQIRLENGVTYEKICPFLGEPLVGHGAPKANTRTEKRIKTFFRKIRSRL